MAIVTISSELGAGGPEIGAALAKRLEYRYLERNHRRVDADRKDAGTPSMRPRSTSGVVEIRVE